MVKWKQGIRNKVLWVQGMLALKMKKKILNKQKSPNSWWHSLNSVLGSDLIADWREATALCPPPHGSRSSLSPMATNTITCWLTSTTKSLQNVHVLGMIGTSVSAYFLLVTSKLWCLRLKDLLHGVLGVMGAKPGGSTFTEFGLGRHQSKAFSITS